MQSQPARRAPVFSVLRSADYRVLWCVGGLVEMVRGMELLILGWLILQTTDSPFQLGLVLVFHSLPRPLLSLFTGFIADRFSRRRILIISQTINVLAATGLLTLIVLSLIQPWHAFVLAFTSGATKALEDPSRRTSILDIVGERRLTNAMSLEVINRTIGRMTGLVLAGVLLDTVDFAGAYAVLLAVRVTILILLTLRVRIPARQFTSSEPIWKGLGVAIKYARHNPTLLGLFWVTLIMNSLAFPVREFIPVIGRDHLNVGITLVGLLVASEGLGQLAGAGLMALTRNPQHLGRVYVLGSMTVLAMAMLFVWSPWYALAFALLTVGGIGEAGFDTMQSTITMLSAPPEMRGRMLGLVGTFIGVGAPLGTLEMGALATINVQWAISGNAMMGLLLLLPIFLLSPLVRRPVTSPPERVSAD